ncbi:lysyl oxidase homolog 3A [Orussus abietinus]|uniref:lysyl oxidase homolog 3A n=1 Tax=Orussus abietinus TaxID=222816 RepID=UPI000625EE01|nr:lysyl oxidase homolog 3A [Orussus abietinus]XP_012287531.1 lysyl oxidase homolog 3A [Orussus abietinus]XP_012287532.1 lysyl oxidase homolog 3A [Orussus abietinus]
MRGPLLVATVVVATVFATRKIHDNVPRSSRKSKRQEGAVRLVDGRADHEGNVEILHEGKWGCVCDDEWDDPEANVVCGQLGFPAAEEATVDGRFGRARRRFWMDNVQCQGNESELRCCRFDGWGANDCRSGEAAGVVCALHRNPENRLEEMIDNEGRSLKKVKIGTARRKKVPIRLAGGRASTEGRVEMKLGKGDWGVVCGDGWSLLEAAVVCRQLGLGFASDAVRTSHFGGQKIPLIISGVRCEGGETNISECLRDAQFTCPGGGENIAGVICVSRMADLAIDHLELTRTAYLEDRQLYWLQCAMEENCVASRAYEIQKSSADWHMETRRLLRFTARIINVGTADFRPFVPKHLWQWHACHMHYHSMEVFATFDIMNSNGTKVAEGHKASFCLEDNQCMPGVQPRYKCANYGDQGISVNCSDIYKHNIDCQWVDITELDPGQYTFKVAVNPEFKVGEMSFDNNAALCRLLYTETFATVHSCTTQRP